MIPLQLRPFVPMILQQIRRELVTGAEAELAGRLTDAIRAELLPAERGKLAKVLHLTAEQLAV